jgi:hypothetical protein
VTLTKAVIEDLASREYIDRGFTATESLFALLVDVADVYLQHIEAQMPDDQPGSPFIAGMMPIEVVSEGLHENLEMRQDEGRRIQ